MTWYRSLERKLRALATRLKVFQQLILLHLFYIVGIGLTAVAAKLVGKHFLTQSTTSGSMWEVRPENENWQQMF